MSDQNYDVTGITPLSSYPEWCHQCASNEFCETDTLCIPCHQLPIESIMSVHVWISICSFETICTQAGKKVFIEGVKHIKVLYVADEQCQSVHAVSFDVPFCSFIILGSACCETNNIFAAVEDIKAKLTDCKCLSLSVLIFVCAENKVMPKPCQKEEHEHHKCVNGDCQHEHYPSSHQTDKYESTKTSREYCDTRHSYFGNQTCKFCPKRHTCESYNYNYNRG